jgi:dihydroorotase
MMQRRTGVRLHLLHTSTIPMIQMIRQAKAEGRPVTSEVNTAFLFLTNSWANVERLGPFSLGMWIPEEHGPAVWEAVADGTVDVIGTDHGPHTKEEKEVGWTNMYKAPGGLPCIQHNLSLFLTAVNQDKLTMKRVVELNSENPAKLTDQYPRKGTIQVGSDADLVVVDMNRRETITIEKTLYKCGWTPYEGQEIQGVPVMTFLRGTLIARDGEVLVEPGFGQFLRPQ